MANFWDADPVAGGQPAQQGGLFYQNDPVAQQPAQPVQEAAPPQQSILDKLTGTNGPRYQLWPERVARSLIGAATDAATLPGDYLQEQTQPPPSQISDSDVSTLSAPRALNFAAFANPLPPGGQTVPTGFSTKSAPTQEQLFKAADAGYKSPEVAALRLKTTVGPDIVSQVKNALLKEKVDQINAPGVMQTIGNLANPRFDNGAFTVSDLDLARQSLNDVPGNEFRAAKIARGVLDNYLANIPTADVLSGDAAAANAKMLEARANYAAAKRSEDVTKAFGRSENQAGSTYSGQGLDNATRQQLRPILNDKTGVAKNPGFQDYTPQEIDALRRGVNGTYLGNTVRTAGKLVGAGHGVGGGLMAIEAARSAHDLGMPLPLAVGVGVGAGAAGWGLNRLGNALTAHQANDIAQLLRMRSPLAAQIPPSPVTAQLPTVGGPMLGFNFGRPILGVVPAGADPYGQQP